MPVPTKVSPAWLYLLGAIVALTLFLPEWLQFPVTDAFSHHRRDGFAGLWGMSEGRWDNLHVDLDIYAFGYLAFAIGLVAVGYMVAVATGRLHLVRTARKVVIALVVAEIVFVVRLLIESGVGFYFLAAIGPAAVIATLLVLRKLERQGT